MIKKNLLKLSLVFVLFISLILIRYNFNSLRLFFSRANLSQEHHFLIYFSARSKTTQPFWQNLAQGGEDSSPMLAVTIPYLKNSPAQYIRLDHIFDNYQTVTFKNNQLQFNWRQLDQAVNEILASGSRPALVLSYFPIQATTNHAPTGHLKNPQLWSQIISQTVRHFSEERGLNNLIYEVWNEPNLFGHMSIKTYLNLYQLTLSSLPPTSTTYLIGGPSWSYFDQKKLAFFLREVKKRKLRLDFFSYHAYHPQPEKILNEYLLAKELLKKEDLPQLPIFITEWGIDGQVNPKYDSNYGYWHTLATVGKLTPFIRPQDKLFLFEVKDGFNPSQKYWGRWGLFTNEKPGLAAKPRWYAWQQLHLLPWRTYFHIDSNPSLSIIGLKSSDKRRVGLLVSNQGQLLADNYLHFRFWPDGLWQMETYAGPLQEEKTYLVVTNHHFDSKLALRQHQAGIIILKQIDKLPRGRGVSANPQDYSLLLTKEYHQFFFIPPEEKIRWLSFQLQLNQKRTTPSNLLSLKVDKITLNLGWYYQDFHLQFGVLMSDGRGSKFFILPQVEENKWQEVSFSTSRGQLKINFNSNQLSLPLTYPIENKVGSLIFLPQSKTKLDNLSYYSASDHRFTRKTFDLSFKK